MQRARDGVDAATITHVVVATDLTAMTKVTIPDDVRKHLAAHIA